MSPPSVLLVFSDSLRYDAAQKHMPGLAELAKESVVFDQCIAQGISTAPSMTASLTATYPLDYGGHWFLHDERPTVAELFKSRAFKTAAIHSNPNVSRLRNFDKGFDHFDEELVPHGARLLLKLIPQRFLRYANYGFRILSREPYLSVEGLNSKAKGWIRSCGELPTFLWMQYMNTHGPYMEQPSSSYKAKARAELLWRKAAVTDPTAVTPEEHRELEEHYASETVYTDDSFARFIEWMRREGILDRFVVVFTADHGDEFFEHGYYGHRNSPFEELIHVPLVVRFPDGEWGGTRISDPVRLIDVAPTVLDYASVWPDAPLTNLMEGVSLMPWIRGEKSGPSADFVITEKFYPKTDFLQIGFRSEKWKFIRDDWRGVRELYDRENDPGELTNVSEEFPDVFREFEARLDARLAEIDERASGFSPVSVEEDPEMLARLRALGYMD